MSSIARCFVALSFAEDAAARLRALLPTPAPGVWPERPANVHLTLHFLGERPVAPVARALAAVSAPPLGLRIGALGTFAGRDAHVLWAGVEGGPALAALHAAVAAALAPLGFTPEARPYRPHVTLGRTRERAAAEAFAARRIDPIAARVDALGLFTSARDGDGVRYDEVARVPLA